ncbi:hypothetical protein Q5P01_012683 [Channa striata]|uniref:G-protein coupled receptors family 1 profile domain-containing protein n=1 Tax=Channa striata TaxID=64152 RepID=A0AA88SNA1_CHASR|nr:hypothetical protein Q5P01_012683 [Channa striata]
MEEYYNDNNTHDIPPSVGFGFVKAQFIVTVGTWIIIGVGLPLNVAAICTTCFLAQKDRVSLIYVINLLISNIIQLCSMIGMLALQQMWFDGYLVITSPLCSCFKKAIQIYEVVCLVIWAVPLLLLLRFHSFEQMLDQKIVSVIAIMFLLPFALFIFFLGGTIKALCGASRVPPDEKRRSVAIQVLVLLIYTMLFLPMIICVLAELHGIILMSVFSTSSRCLPLMSMFVYLFLRKGAADKFLSCVCCCTMDNSEISSRENDDTVVTVSLV